MRLIDADDRKLRTELTYYTCWTGIDEVPYLFAVDMLDKAATIDAVPVIRCKDCKHYFEKEWIVGGGSYTTCWYQTIANAQPNDFCSRAERKEE